MRASMIGLTALALVASATPALAQDEAKEFTLSGTAALVSDYRFRGLSQSAKRIAIQGGATLAHASGAYVSFWASSIDDDVCGGCSSELDLIAGYSTTVGALTLDGGVLYYVYPGGFANIPTDFFEVYGSVKGTFGPATLKAGVAYAPKQRALTLTGAKLDNLYLYTDASGSLGDTGLGVAAHVGYSKDSSYLTGGSYWDWNLGLTYTMGPATFGVAYVDTDKPKGSFIGANSGRNLAKAGVVGSLTFAF